MRGLALAVVLLLGILWLVYGGGRHQGPGVVVGARLPEPVVAARGEAQRALAPAAAPAAQILFGDLHVHTTFSADAFLRSLPLLNGEGAHPPADACDFARFCSGLDFFSLNDHAEALTPRHWRETKETIRRCNALAGDPANPDLVAFAGWEWSQVGVTPEDHWGHRNVVFRDDDEERLPARPIGAPGMGALFEGAGGPSPWLVPLLEFPRRQAYLDFGAYQRENRAVRDCPAGVDTRELPADCRETAATPAELLEKLGQWGFESLVIPHGTTWGFYTPPGYRWRGARQDERERLIEVYSGHGSSEEYRPWRDGVRGPDGRLACPEPTAAYEPCCWRAGEIVRARCGDAPAAECERRVRDARARYLEAGVAGHLVVPGASVEDWGDCGQCRDCFLPAFTLRPGGSVQYVLAAGRATFGFIGSSDNHSARPGTGYKEYARRKTTDAAGARDETWRRRTLGPAGAPAPEAIAVRQEDLMRRVPWQVVHVERQASFFLTGGLAAVHAAGRSREAIWEALRRREVYATSGPRILLWFDLLNAPGGRRPMGADVELGGPPRFAARAVGDFVQRPGCPDWSVRGLPPERLARLCAGECRHPGDVRHRITRVEVVRVRSQLTADEPVDGLIDDPWRRLECPPDPAGCRVEFEDPEFGARPAAYYVRAVQEPTPAVNGGLLRCERDAEGRCLRARPCYGDYRTPEDDDCLAPVEERAWSSPIFLRPG